MSTKSKKFQLYSWQDISEQVLRFFEDWSFMLCILSCFQSFFLNFKCFSLIFYLKWRKKVWKNCVLSYSLKLVDMQTLVDSLRGCLKIVFVILMLNLIREKWEGGDIYLVNWSGNWSGNQIRVHSWMLWLNPLLLVGLSNLYSGLEVSRLLVQS